MSEDLLPGLREELVAAAWRARGRHRRRRVLLGAGAAAAAAAVVVVAVLAVASSDPAEAGVEIEIVDDRITVELTAVETRPAVVEAALRDVGLDATVTSRPVGPSNVGRFLAAETDLPGGVEPIDRAGQSFAGFAAPVDLRDELVLVLGRPADGDDYSFASDAYAPGEPLSCSSLYGEPVAQLVDFAAAHPDLTVTVQPFDAGGPVGTARPLADSAEDPLVSTLLLTDATSLAADAVTVYVTEDGSSPFVEPLSPDRGACRE